MSCGADILTRYIIALSGRDLKIPIPIGDIISISGLGMGDQGTVTLTQQDRIVEIPDGIRKLPNLVVESRFKPYDLASATVKDKLFDWYNKRNIQTYDLTIFITNRTFCPTHAYKYISCSIKNIVENDKLMGKSDFSILTSTFTPYDIVAFTNPLEAMSVYNIPTAPAAIVPLSGFGSMGGVPTATGV